MKIEELYNSLNPASVNLRPFPYQDDRGEKEGDELLAETIYYGFQGNPGERVSQIDERQIAWAIKLGRELEKNNL